MTILTINGISLPAPVSISSSGEIIWSSNTQRTASGLMVGDVIAEKTTIEVTWGILNEDDAALIESAIPAGFFTVTLQEGGRKTVFQAYRGALRKESLGEAGGRYYYRSMAVSLVQQ